MKQTHPKSRSAALTPVEWVRRVNRQWIVRGNLRETAEAWLDHLAESGDARLEAACEAARDMCGLRNPADDPKPWFYSGLFSPATKEEALRFLHSNRITKAAIPAMADDEDVRLWLDRVSQETRDLMERLRDGISHLQHQARR